jgi:hypothetical protein
MYQNKKIEKIWKCEEKVVAEWKNCFTQQGVLSCRNEIFNTSGRSEDRKVSKIFVTHTCFKDCH